MAITGLFNIGSGRQWASQVCIVDERPPLHTALLSQASGLLLVSKNPTQNWQMSLPTLKKRKVDAENWKFNSEWTEKYVY